MTSPSPSATALLTLLPSFTPATLPKTLLSLALSLLAQSRLRASQLKPEEEIGRAYACAEIAVNRLREPLRLPPKKTAAGGGRRGTGGPPCKPSVYKKLLGFLEGVLEREIVTPQSTNKRKRDAVPDSAPAAGEEEIEGDQDESESEASEGFSPSDAAAAACFETPTKKARNISTADSRKQPAPKTSGTFTGRIGTVTRTVRNEEAPASLLPSIRRLTTLYATPTMAPHIYTGVCIILGLAELWPPPSDISKPADKQQGTGMEPSTIPALTTALFLMVLTKMQIGQLKTKTFNQVCADAVKMFSRGAKGSAVLEKKHIESWIRRINQEGWCKGQQWWEGVPESTLTGITLPAGNADEDGNADSNGGPATNSGDALETTGGEAVADADIDVVVVDEDSDADEDDEDVGTGPPTSRRRLAFEDADKADPEGVLLPGLGTMMQESLDWNSAERTRTYEVWKKGVLKKLSTGGGAAGTGFGAGVGSARKGKGKGKGKATPSATVAGGSASGSGGRRSVVAAH